MSIAITADITFPRHTDVGTDKESAKFWRLDARQTLPLFGRWLNDGHNYEARILPDGDIMLITNGRSWKRLTTCEDRIEEYRIRQDIVGHRYHPALADVLAQLERAGVRDTLYSWLGGTFGLRRFELTCQQRCHADASATGVEKVARLVEYLHAVQSQAPELVAEALRILDEVGPVAITAIVTEEK